MLREKKMDAEGFRKYGKEVIDYICDYSKNIEQRNVAPTLDPGYLKQLLPGIVSEIYFTPNQNVEQLNKSEFCGMVVLFY